MEDRQRRYDWSWLMCYYVREWERKLAMACAEQGKILVNAHFAWYHYHEICDRTLAKAEQRIEVARQAITSRDLAQLSRYTGFLIHDILIPECEREFDLLSRAAADHGLSTYAPVKGES